MPGNAILDDGQLVDSLVTDVIDGLRGELHPDFGVRPYRLFTVMRIWDGDSVGQGNYTDISTEVTPQPRVMNLGKYQQSPSGTTDQGEIKITEISLTYTHDDLMGQPLDVTAEWLFRLSDAYGQEQPDREFIASRPPFIDREKNMGWVLYLRHYNKPGCAARP